jgi:hypothetical protein
MAQNDQIDLWRTEMNTNLKEVRSSLQDLLLEIKQRPTRQEIEALLATKIGADIFNAELKAVRDDIVELRQKPEAIRNWTSTAVAVGGCAMTLVSVVLSAAISVGAILLQHWH